jgi:putative SOS response-associated peptidase YedK
MCYYNGQKVTRVEFIKLKALEKAVSKYNFLNVGLHDGFNFAPTAILVPTKSKTDFEIIQAEWGFIPSYIEDREEAAKMRLGYIGTNGRVKPKPNLNARSENLFTNEEGTRPSIFKAAAHNGRCLILSTGFFEWRHIKRRGKRTGKELESTDKYPYYITLKDQPYFYMAGVYQPWTDKKTGEHVITTAIVTAPANRLMYHIHNTRKRMPAILNDVLAWKWMMEDLSDEEIMEIARTQHNYEEMDYCTVSPEFKAKLEPEEAFAYSEKKLPAFNLSIEPGEESPEPEQLSLF